MKLVVPILLAGCGGPVIVQTSADQHAIQLAAMGTGYVSEQEVDDRAQRHCATFGLVSRRTEVETVNASSRVFRFECDAPRRLSVDSATDRKPSDAPSSGTKTPPVRNAAERKQAAWEQAHAMSPGWLKCLTGGAAQSAHASSQPVAVAAVAVVAGCARWERDLHEVLRKAGEDDRDFEVALHQQVIGFAADRIVSARTVLPDGPEPAAAEVQAVPARAAAR
jgi:hypothetical protein